MKIQKTPKTQNLLQAYSKLSHVNGRFYRGLLLPAEIILLSEDGNAPSRQDIELSKYWVKIGKRELREVYILIIEQNKNKVAPVIKAKFKVNG